MANLMFHGLLHMEFSNPIQLYHGKINRIVFSGIFVNCDQNEAQKQSFDLIHGIQVLCASIWSHLTLFRLYFQQFGHIFAVSILLSDIKQE